MRVTVVDLAKDPCPMGSLARSTTLALRATNGQNLRTPRKFPSLTRRVSFEVALFELWVTLRSGIPLV
jgi:hypothetical protein